MYIYEHGFACKHSMCTCMKQKAFGMQKSFTIKPLNNLNQHVQYIETHSGLKNYPFCCSNHLCVSFIFYNTSH